MATNKNDREAILRALEALESRFRDEHARHVSATAEMRAELHEIVKRGDSLGVSASSMAKAMKISRGRLTRMLKALR